MNWKDVCREKNGPDVCDSPGCAKCISEAATGLTSLGKAFRMWRAENGMLLIHASTLMGIKPSALSAWETGRHPWPRYMRERVELLIGYENFTPTPTEQSDK